MDLADRPVAIQELYRTLTDKLFRETKHGRNARKHSWGTDALLKASVPLVAFFPLRQLRTPRCSDPSSLLKHQHCYYCALQHDALFATSFEHGRKASAVLCRVLCQSTVSAILAQTVLQAEHWGAHGSGSHNTKHPC